MTRWSKVRAVSRFELTCVVRSKSWLIATFGMPVFVLAYGALITLPQYFGKQHEEELAVCGVVDEPGLLGLAADLPATRDEVPPAIRAALEATGRGELLERQLAAWNNFVFRPFGSAESARAALLGGEIRGYFRLPPDYLQSGVLEQYWRERPDLAANEAREAFGGLVTERMLAGRIEAPLAARVRKPFTETRRWVVTPAGELKAGGVLAVVLRLVVPLGFSVLLLVAVLMTAGGLIQATAVKKENRVVEVLLSSAGPHEILIGKLLGLGTAGVMQMTVWFGMAAAAGGMFAAALAAAGVEMPWGAMAAGVVLFVAAYLFYGSLMLGTGSLGSNQRESQQWAMVWSLGMALPMIFTELVLHEPHGTAGRVMTWIPFTAATTLVMRLTLDPAGVAWWEFVGALAVLVGATWVALRLSARLFRVGIMLTGARPKLRDILRQARLG